MNKANNTQPENGWPSCPKCGANLHWNADFMASELGLVDADDTANDTVVNCLSCPDCECDYYYRDTEDGQELTDVSTY